MKKITKIFILLIGLFFYSNSTYCQTVDFTTVPAVNLEANTPITFYNNSTGFPSNTIFVWDLGDVCSILPVPATGQPVIITCKDTTIGISNTVSHIYTDGNPKLVTLTAVPASGASISSSKYVMLAAACNCIPNTANCNLNLICNFEFRDTDFCIRGQEQLGYDFCSPYGYPTAIVNSSTCWYSASTATSADLWSSRFIPCTTCQGYNSPTNIPNNFLGCHPDNSPPLAMADMGYAGVLTHLVGSINEREYLQQDFGTPLVQDAKYNISFYVSPAEKAAYATDIGAHISVNPPLLTGPNN